MTYYSLYWDATTKKASVVKPMDPVPAGTKVASFDHDDDISKENHVIYHHVRDILYSLDIEDMRNIEIDIQKNEGNLLLSQDYVLTGSAIGTVIGGFSVSGDPFGLYTFTEVTDADNAFTVDKNKLKLAIVPNYATKSVYSVTVKATPLNGGPDITGTFSIYIQKALSALPLSSDRKLYQLGDSQLGYNHYQGAALTLTSAGNKTNFGFAAWAQALDPRFDISTWFEPTDPLGRAFVGSSFALFGDHLGPAGVVAVVGLVNRVPDVLAKNPKVVLFNGGFNTIHSNDDAYPGTTEYVTYMLEKALHRLYVGGAIVHLVVPWPTKAWPEGDHRYTVLAEVQDWCRKQAGRPGVMVLDATEIIAPGGVIDPTLLQGDFIHLSAKGAQAVAELYNTIAAQTWTAGSVFDKVVANSNLLTANQYNMVGTTGTKTGTPAPTGNVPTDWIVTRGRNCLINCVPTVGTNGEDSSLKLEVTPGGSDTGNYYEITVNSPDYTITTGEPTKWYGSSFKIDVDKWECVHSVEGQLGFYVGTSTAVARSSALTRGSSASFNLGGKAGPKSFWLVNPPVYNQSASATINRYRGYIRITGPKTAAPFTITISKPIYREFVNPKSAWGY